MSYHTINHPNIGQIRGIRTSNGIIQYLSVQYATLKDRFSHGKLLERTPGPNGILEATKLGPIALIPPNGCEFEQALIQKTLPFPQFEQSDTECLTVNITVPDINNGSLFPVLAFVHGGGFMTGSSSFPQNDLAHITAMSFEIGLPIIAVSINYRVGAPGFLYSSEMKAANYKPNNGLDDQRLALRWIKDNIAGFGGDPKMVTFLGESAGAASGSFHLHSAEPLFHQFIAMSGTSLLRPRSVELVERSFRLIAEVLGAKEYPPNEQLQIVLNAPKEEFIAKVGRRFTIGPIVDGDIIPEMTKFESLSNEEELKALFPGIRHCKRILIGDCQMDGMIWGLRIVARIDIFPKTLERCLSTVFDPIDVKLTPAILSAYAIDTSATSNTEEGTRSVLNFGNDITFALPASSFARAWSSSSIPGTDAFLYHFNCPNPWDGPWKGHATHALDLMFVLQNYKDSLIAGQQQCGERFARDIIGFVNGADPWPAFRKGRDPGSMIYYAPADGEKDKSEFVVDETSDRIGRRDILNKLVDKELLEKLLDAWQMFMRGPQ